MRLHVTLSEEDSKEFHKNIDNQIFTEDQIQRFKHAREIYQKHKHEFKEVIKWRHQNAIYVIVTM